MAYPAEIVSAAYKTLAERRESAARKTEKRRAEIFSALPEARSIEQELSQTSAKLARTILSGDDVEKKIQSIRDYNLAGQEKLRALLIQHGYAPDSLEHIPFCKVCGDTGIAPDGSVCGCVHEIERACTLEKLTTGADCAGKDFSTFDLSLYPNSARETMQKILNLCRNYAEAFSLSSESLLMIGAPGLGKTHLSLSIAFRVIERGYYAVYTPFHRLISQLEKARFGHSDEEYAAVMRTPLECELLVLDDLGSEMSTQFTAAALYEIVNTRLLEGRPTIISTNLSGNEITERYGDRIYSRLFGTYRKLPFVGNDIRLMHRR